jgi:hypothetical protein
VILAALIAIAGFIAYTTRGGLYLPNSAAAFANTCMVARAERAHHQAEGRFATLSELVDRGYLSADWRSSIVIGVRGESIRLENYVLTVETDREGRFTLRAEPDFWKRPWAKDSEGRSFFVDETYDIRGAHYGDGPAGPESAVDAHLN